MFVCIVATIRVEPSVLVFLAIISKTVNNQCYNPYICGKIFSRSFQGCSQQSSVCNPGIPHPGIPGSRMVFSIPNPGIERPGSRDSEYTVTYRYYKPYIFQFFTNLPYTV